MGSPHNAGGILPEFHSPGFGTRCVYNVTKDENVYKNPRSEKKGGGRSAKTAINEAD